MRNAHPARQVFGPETPFAAGLHHAVDYLTPSYAAMSMSIARLCLEGLLKTYELTLASPEFAGEEYRAANPDDWKSIGVMARKFNAWLREMQHAAIAEVVAG